MSGERNRSVAEWPKLPRLSSTLPTSLFAALDVASGFVISKCYKRHRAAEFLDFIKQVDAQVPKDLDVHIIMDNYATHKTAAIRTWLARRPHYHVHFTPTSASWINQVERWFAELTARSCGAASILRPASSKLTSAHSSSGTTRTPNLTSGPSPPTRSSRRQALLQKAEQTLCGETLDLRD